MASLYDSEKVRLAAIAVSSMADEFEENAVRTARETVRSVEPLKGQAAAALEECLHEMVKSLTKLCDDLKSVSHDLDRYASTLETVVEKLKAEM